MSRTSRPSVASRTRSKSRSMVRYAVVGAGHIAQNAVLPAFAHAKQNCVLTALFSDDERKRRVLGKRYGLEHTFPYEEFDEACRADLFDAVYIALPNSMHAEYVERAAAAGIHVLCEKPMAGSSVECAAMIEAAKRARVKLMIAYRLHFEAANLDAIKIARSGKLGDLRLFHAAFSMQVRPENIRLSAELDGGPLYDIGIYCINAMRFLFDDEPTEVCAISASGKKDARFREVEEAFGAVLKFPGEKIATFTCSFGAASTGWLQLVGTKGDLRLDPAYEYEGELAHSLTINDRTKEKKYPPRDQFAPQLIYFARCIQEGVEPEPGGVEGLIDVRIIEAIQESAKTGERVILERLPRDPRPQLSQEMRRPPVKKPRLVSAASAHGD